MQTERRELALDTATGRIGEITHTRRENGVVVEIWLRPRGGGVEWSPGPDNVRRILHEPDCACRGTGTISRVVPLADAVLLTDEACPGHTDADDR